MHASWLNQIELYFSIVQRKSLTPNDLPNLQALTERLLPFAAHYRQIARPFEWTLPAATSTTSWPKSPTASPISDSRPNDPNFRTALLAPLVTSSGYVGVPSPVPPDSFSGSSAMIASSGRVFLAIEAAFCNPSA